MAADSSGPLANQLAERYRLHLTPQWRQWFDVDAGRQLLAGPYRTPIDLAELLQTAPPDLWPGFMLPDTLPIVSNDYGDWWCLRVGADNAISEVIQWSHGGGDWLPVGNSIGEAALWDHVQHWRRPAIEVAQAAHEYPARQSPGADEHKLSDSFLPWLSSELHCSIETLDELLSKFEQGHYRQALEVMLQHQWASSAAACELVEVALQGQLGKLADSQLARRCGINWVPEYTSWLFDTAKIPETARNLLIEHAPSVRFDQDWSAAEKWANHLLQQRSDLSWPGDISGWAALRRGDLAEGLNRLFTTRHTSAFTDQSVRLRSHWFAENFGKFSVAQLAAMQSQLTLEQASDPYLNLLWNEPPQRTRSAVREFWLAQARQNMSDERYEEGYYFYTLAGWDLGAERMSDYIEILDGLVTSARLAGWSARAAIAATHAESLKRRLTFA